MEDNFSWATSGTATEGDRCIPHQLRNTMSHGSYMVMIGGHKDGIVTGNIRRLERAAPLSRKTARVVVERGRWINSVKNPDSGQATFTPEILRTHATLKTAKTDSALYCGDRMSQTVENRSDQRNGCRIFLDDPGNGHDV